MTENKVCQTCQRTFEINPNEIGLYSKLLMPLPSACFECRIKQMLAFWTFGKFRKGKSDLSGESLITVLPEKTRYPVYTSHEWYSDAWDAMDHAQGYNPSIPFLKQLKVLQEKVPRPHQTGRNNIDCDWCDDVWESKNCYLNRSFINCENVSYGYRNFNVRNSLDIAYCYDTELSYDTVFCFKANRLKYAFDCSNCINSAFLYDCTNCQDCFMCWNLRDKKYHILNQPYSKEEYQAKLKEFNLGSRKVISELQDQFRKHIREEAMHRENFNIRSETSTGNFLTNCDKCFNGFHWESSQDCYNMVRGGKAKNLIDCTGCFDVELCGGSNGCHFGGYNLKYCSWCTTCRDSEYLDLCIECRDCFGCVGLKKKKFCILNKQYTEEEYKKLKTEIIEAMQKDGSCGKFFPYDLAYSGYNFTTAQIYFPDTKANVEKLGSFWEEASDPATDGISPEELPDDIKDVRDDITTQALICPKTGYRFNVAQREIDLYRELSIPLPLYHPDYRTLQRFEQMKVMTPFKYNCTLCNKEIQTYYPKEWGYKKVVCIPCYQKQIY